jgi:stage V sporulation protein B
MRAEFAQIDSLHAFEQSAALVTTRPHASDDDSSAQAGRGGVGILAAKIFFIASGLLQQALLSRVLGLGGYGALARVQPFTNILNNVTVAASIQGVSRAVAGPSTQTAGVINHGALRAALRLHIPLALFLGGGSALLAPWLAAYQGAREIETPLVVMALVLTIYGVYAPLVGALNGRRKFLHQAGLDIMAASLRTAGLVGMGFAFRTRGYDGPLGATVGAALSAVCILPIAILFTKALRRPHSSDRSSLDSKAYLLGLVPLAFIQLGTNLLMQVDILTLGHFLSTAAARETIASGGKAANEWVGVYRGCQLFAFLPYQLLVSLTQVLFPMVAKARAAGDRVAVQRYVSQGTRVGLIAAFAMVSIIVALPGPLLSLLYPAELAARGASTLRVLAAAHGLFAMMGICMSVLASLGKERVGAGISAGAVALYMGLLYWRLARAAFGESQLLETAASVAFTLAITLAVSGAAVQRFAGSFVPWSTVFRVVVGAACVAWVAHLLGSEIQTTLFGRALVLAKATVLGLTYVAVLTLTRELGAKEASAIVAIVRKRRPAPRAA